MIRGWPASGVTVLLTTQYLEEADQLARAHRRHRPRPQDRRGHEPRAEGRDRLGLPARGARRPGRLDAAAALLEARLGARSSAPEGARLSVMAESAEAAAAALRR
jgi:ABC-2 type transport system ATP-binding protein